MDSHVHDLSGFLPIVKIGGVSIPIYFLIISLSFIVSIFYLVRRGEKRGLDRNRLLDLSLVIMLTGFIGARLFHVFVEEPQYYLAKPLLIFDILSGGFVWYGGALLAAVSGVIFLKLKNERIAPWLDLFAPVGALGYAVGRVACFATGCCFGKIVQLPEFLGGWTVRYPTQALAVAFELMILSILLFIEKLQEDREAPEWLREPGQIIFAWIVMHGLCRIIMELFRGDPRGPEPLGLSVATWVSLGLIVCGSWFFFRFARASRLRI